jgi:hypothetical protein
MFKKSFLTVPFLFLMAYSTCVYGQNLGDLQDSLDLQFSLLNTSKLNTGVLIDKTLRLSGVEKFDGIQDTRWRGRPRPCRFNRRDQA